MTVNKDFCNDIINESVMSKIRQRIKTACENVAFYANKTWTCDSFYYQKASEALCATIIKLRYLMVEESTKARTVRDMIPYSKLAQYSNYEYNEAREMSYASQVSDISFYYPCLYKKDSMIEPWMLPEVEQIFIWLTYSKQFNFFQSIEELYCISNNMTPYLDFHEFKPIYYENFERTPGKTRFTVNNFLTEDDYKMATYYLWSHMLSIDCFDDMLLKMKIRSDKVRCLWTSSKETIEEVKNKKMRIFKTSLDNYYANDMKSNNNNNFNEIDSNKVPHCFGDFRNKTCDFRKLQKLIDDVNNLRIQSTVQNTAERIKSIRTRLKTEHVPTKRLYSDVVQGLSNKTSPIKSQMSEITSPDSSKNTINETPALTPRTTTSTYITTEDSDQISQIKSVKSSQTTEWNCTFKTSCSPKLQQPIVVNNTSKHNAKITKDCCGTMNNTNCNNNSANYLVSTIIDCNNPCDLYSYNPYINSNVSNFYPNHQYQQYSSTSYQTPYQSYNTSNSFVPITTTYTNQMSSGNLLGNATRQATNSNPLQYNNNQTHNYYLNQYRNIYLTPQPYFILQQPLPKTNQRWVQQQQQQHQQQQHQHQHHQQSQHTIRPNTPQTYTTQQSNQYLNLSNSNYNQQIYSSSYHQHQQLYDNNNNSSDTRQRNKPKKFATTQSKTIINKNLEYDLRTIKQIGINAKNTTGYGDVLPLSNDKTIYVKTNTNDVTNEYKLVLRKDNSSNFDVESNCEELEAQALNEYQSSNESFYKELEKEAVEQYEDNSENLTCPPNNELVLFGGLLLIQNLTVFAINISNYCNCFSIIRGIVTS